MEEAIQQRLHHVGQSCLKIECTPTRPAAPPDNDGRVVKLLTPIVALDDSDGTCGIGLGSLRSISVDPTFLTARSAAGQQAAEHFESAWSMADTALFPGYGQPSALQVTYAAGGQLLLVVGTSSGAVFRCTLCVEQQGNLKFQDVQTEDGTNTLVPWHPSLHTSSVSAVAVNSESQDLVTAGADGGIHLLQLDSNAQHTLKEASPYSEYIAAKWVDTHTVVTASSITGIECWDTRTAGSRVASSPAQLGASGSPRAVEAQMTCLAVHPSRPELCATGDTHGSVALWDLRLMRPATWIASGKAAGPTWQVRFDTYAASKVAVLFCNEEGELRTASLAASSNVESQILCQAPGAMLDFDVDGNGRDIVCVTDVQSVLHARRRTVL